MSGDRAAPLAAVLLAQLAAPEDRALDEHLGAEGARALREAVVRRARVWAAATAPDVAFEATTLGAGLAALHDHTGPAIFAAPDVPLLDAALVADVLADLEAGCDASVGAAHDGRPYVLALRDPHAAHDLALEPRDDVLRALASRGLSFGLLRSERRLVGPADVRALAIDPLAPEDLLPLLRPPTS